MIYCEYSPKECYIKVHGHAGYSAPGTDIVCSAVSALELSLLAMLEKSLNGCCMTVQLDEDGDFIQAHKPDQVVRSWFELVWEGFSCISEKYSNYCTCILH